MLATDVSELRHDGKRQRRAENVMPEQIDERHGVASDDVLKALKELEGVLRENAESERLLSKRIADVREARENGREWKAILGDAPQQVGHPLVRHPEEMGDARDALTLGP